MGRTPSHRRAMMSNMLAALIEHRRIKTTERKARDLRSLAEKTVTRFTALGDLLLKDRTSVPDEDKARIVHAMRMVRRTLKDRGAILTLYNDIAPRFLGRPGGYTRIYKTGVRQGDGAPMAILEFIEAEMPDREGPATPAGEKKKKGILGKLKRGKK
jgi:large subunit ribosomal protein L17